MKELLKSDSIKETLESDRDLSLMEPIESDRATRVRATRVCKVYYTLLHKSVIKLQDSD